MAKQDLYFSKPLTNMPGFFGFVPNARNLETIHQYDELGGFGAFVTDPISWHPRSVAQNSFITAVDGLSMVHTGFPNRGFRGVVKTLAGKWSRAPLPIIPTLLDNHPDAISEMLSELEWIENLLAVNIIPRMETLTDVQFWLNAITGTLGELPAILSLPAGLIPVFGKEFIDRGVSAICPLPARGCVIKDGEAHYGRLYGSAFYPSTLRLTEECSLLGIPLIAAGGIDQPEKIKAIGQVGALATALDMPLW